MEYAELKSRLARSPFRARFPLTRRERAYLAAHPRPVLEAELADFIG